MSMYIHVLSNMVNGLSLRLELPGHFCNSNQCTGSGKQTENEGPVRTPRRMQVCMRHTQQSCRLQRVHLPVYEALLRAQRAMPRITAKTEITDAPRNCKCKNRFLIKNRQQTCVHNMRAGCIKTYLPKLYSRIKPWQTDNEKDHTKRAAHSRMSNTRRQKAASEEKKASP